MKTYKELEREAYITGNTELAKAYAQIIDLKDTVVMHQQEDYDDYKNRGQPQ